MGDHNRPANCIHNGIFLRVSVLIEEHQPVCAADGGRLFSKNAKRQ